MRRKKIIKRIREVRHSILMGLPHSLTFKPTGKLTKDEVETLQRSLNASFSVWRESWILPLLDEIEAEVGKGLKSVEDIRGFTMKAPGGK